MTEQKIKKPKVYYKKDVSAGSFFEIYKAVGRSLTGKVFALIDEKIAAGSIIDEFLYEIGCVRNVGEHSGEKSIPVCFYGHLQGENFIKEEFANFNSFVCVSLFKRSGGEFGGSAKNLSLGMASEGGKMWIKSAGFTKDSDVMFSHVVHDYRYRESKVEAGKSVVDFFGRANFIYINIVRGEGGALGLFAGVDPVAVDKASFDMLLNWEKDLSSFTFEDDTREFEYLLDYAEKVGLGEQDYKLIEI